MITKVKDSVIILIKHSGIFAKPLIQYSYEYFNAPF